MVMTARTKSPTLVPRRRFLQSALGGLGGLSFVIPLYRNGALGQPVFAPGPWFADLAQRSGLAAFRDTCGSLAKDYLVETVGGGVALFDYNGDGLLDIFIVNGSSFQILDNPRVPRTSSRLFRNNGDGTFTDVTRQSGLVNDGWGMGVAVADFDNDGHRDVFITNYGRNRLFHNNGNGSFTDVTQEAGLGGGNWSTGCAWSDYDRDGRLDLYVARYVDFNRAAIPPPGTYNYCLYQGVPVACGPLGLPGLADLLYHNEGGGKFREVSIEAGVRDTDKAYGFSVVWCDFDNDGWPDAYVANDSMPNYLWHNKRNGTFEEIGMAAGCAVSGDGRPQSSMGVAVGDYDNDGWMDLLVTNFSEDYDTLYHNVHGEFDDVSYAAGLGTTTYAQLGWGTGFIDFDNDGWLDLFIANGHIYPQADKASNHYFQHNQLFRNLHDGRFALLADRESGFGQAWSSRGTAWGDLNNDGAVEIVVNNIDQVPFLYTPSKRAGGNWVRVNLEGAKSNRDAIGARVVVTSGKLTQTDEVRAGDSYLSTCDLRLHFGVGEAQTIDRLEIRWPSGQVESHDHLAVNRQHQFKERV
ncbi:MAG TPA: CRTAC1 family protein [Terriglobia bacterium]|nr:CRTAC1 family protein [Terriglobia bacterium]